MKKILTMLLSLAMLLPVLGCGAGDVPETELDVTESVEVCDHRFIIQTLDPADCVHDGSAEIVCQHCGAQYKAFQNILDHDWAEADCTTPMTCKDCGLSQGDVLPHTFINGECSLCGAPDPDNSISWDLSKGVLTLSGVGRMKDETPWWDYRSSIKEIVISEGITYIAANAFTHTEITEVILPDSVTALGESAFYWNDELTTVILPDGIGVIPDNCFGQSRNLKDVSFPKGVKEIGTYAFGCSAIVDLVLPEGLEVIGETAFGYSHKLKTVEIPASVRSIGDSAFYNCDALHTVTIHEGAESIGYHCFSNCPSLTEIHIPASVGSIDEYAFEDSEKVVIYAPAGSYAETFAAENGIRFVAE